MRGRNVKQLIFAVIVFFLSGSGFCAEEMHHSRGEVAFPSEFKGGEEELNRLIVDYGAEGNVFYQRIAYKDLGYFLILNYNRGSGRPRIKTYVYLCANNDTEECDALLTLTAYPRQTLLGEWRDKDNKLILRNQDGQRFLTLPLMWEQ